MNTKKFECQLSLLETAEESVSNGVQKYINEAVDKILSLPTAIFKQENQKILINSLINQKDWLLAFCIKKIYALLIKFNSLGVKICDMIEEEGQFVDAKKARELELENYKGIDDEFEGIGLTEKMNRDIELYNDILEEMEAKITILRNVMRKIQNDIYDLIDEINEKSLTTEKIYIDLFMYDISSPYQLIDSKHNDKHDGAWDNGKKYVDFTEE